MKKNILLLPLLMLVLASCVPNVNTSSDSSGDASSNSSSEGTSSDTSTDSTISSTGTSITPDEVSSVVISALGDVNSLRATDTLQLSVEVLPVGASDKSVTWASSDISIASVDSNGLVTAHTIGDVEITATSNSVISVSDSYDIYVFADHNVNWPASQIAEFLGAEITTVIPSAASSSGYYFYDYSDPEGQYADMFYIEIDSTIATVEDDYIAVLEAAGYSISDLNYASWGYEAIDPYFTVEVDVLYDVEAQALTIIIYRYLDLYGEAPDVSETWPAEAINDYLGSEVIGALVPSFTSDSLFVSYVSGEGEEAYLVIYTLYATIEGETIYHDALAAAGWIIDDTNYETIGYAANDPAEQIVITFYWWDGEIIWVITPFFHEPEPEPADGTALFDFSTTDQRQSLTTDQQVWLSDDAIVTLTISKGAGSAVADYSNPLRVYADHIVSFSIASGYVFDSIVITTGSANYANLVGSATISGGTALAEGVVATITAGASVTTISFTVTAQTRWISILVNYSEVI